MRDVGSSPSSTWLVPRPPFTQNQLGLNCLGITEPIALLETGRGGGAGAVNLSWAQISKCLPESLTFLEASWMSIPLTDIIEVGSQQTWRVNEPKTHARGSASSKFPRLDRVCLLYWGGEGRERYMVWPVSVERSWKGRGHATLGSPTVVLKKRES